MNDTGHWTAIWLPFRRLDGRGPSRSPLGITPGRRVTLPLVNLPSVCHLPVITPSRTRETNRGALAVAYRECVATAQYRTLLEQLIRQGRWTIEETCLAFEKTAREMRESATLSPRQLARWMRGDVGQARPVAQRVAEAFWGRSFETLLGSPQVMSEHER